MKAICYFFNRVLRMEQPVLDFFNRPVCNPGSGSLSAHLFHGSGQILGSDAHFGRIKFHVPFLGKVFGEQFHKPDKNLFVVRLVQMLCTPLFHSMQSQLPVFQQSSDNG